MVRLRYANPQTLPRRCTSAAALCCVSIVCAVLFGTAFEAKAQTLFVLSSSNYTQNFNSLGSSASTNVPTGWFATTNSTNFTATGGTNVTVAYGTAGTGAVTGTSGGGVVNWGSGTNATATDRALGFLNTGTYTTGKSLVFGFTNSTGSSVTNLSLAWDYEKYRSGTRAWTWTFAYSTNGSSWITNSSGGLAYAADANNNVVNPPTTTTNISLNIGSLSIGNGSSVYLRWTLDGNGGSSNGQGLAVDNFSMTASYGGVAAAYVWNGVSGNWDTGFGSMITNNQAIGGLTFAANVTTAATNNLAGLTVTTMVISNTAGDFTVSGNAFNLTGGVTNNSGNAQVFSNNINLSSAQTISNSAGSLRFDGNLTNAAGLTIGMATNTVVQVNGVLSGAQALTKEGDGTLVLNNASSSVATLAANAGTITLSNSLAATGLTGGGAINITNGTFTVTSAANQTYSGALSGAGTFAKAGSGTATLTGASTHAGGTLISAGALQIGSGGTTGSLAGTITNNATLVFNRSDNLTQSSAISGTGALTKSGAGTLTLSASNTFGGAVSVTAGALRATHGSALGTNATGSTVSSGAALELSGGITVSGEALSLSGTGISSGGALRNISGDNTYGGAITLGAATRINSDAGTLTLDVASGNAITGTQNLTIGGAGNITVNDAIATGTGSLTKEGAGTLVFAGSNTFTGALAHNEGRIVLTNGNALADTVAVTLANTASVTLEVDSNETIGSLSGGGAAGGTVALDTNSLTLNQSGNTSFTGAVAGSGTLIKSGAGTLTLNRATAIDPDFTLRINQGTVDLDRGGASLFGILGANNAVELSGGTLEFSSDAGAETGVNAKSFSLLSASTILINRTGGPANHTTTMTTPFLFMNGSTVTLDYVGSITSGNKATTTYSGTNTLNSDATIRVQNSAGGTAEVIFSGAFSDGGSGFGLTKLGSQTMTLSAANTYTGDTVVGQGALQLSGSGRIADGSRVVVSNGATMNFNSISDTVEGLSGAGSVSLGSATLTLSNITADTFSGTISGAGGIVKTGAGTQVLSGANTYSGATTIGGGTLRIDGNSRLGNTTTTMTISNAGVLDVTAAGTLTNAITIGAGNGVLSNSSGGALVIAGAVSKNGTVLTSRSGSGTNVFTGVISGANANSDFIVDGGTTVFSNVMTYNGPTIITNGGTLVLGADDAMPSGSNLILGGGTFRVGVLNYNADSTLSMGTLTLTANSTIDLGGFGTSGDRNLVFANSSGPSIVWTPGAVLTITNWQGVALAQSEVTKLMFGTGGLDSDQLAQIYFADQAVTGGVLIGLNGELSPIPEARIIWAALALTLFIIWRERRRWLPIVRSITPPRH